MSPTTFILLASLTTPVLGAVLGRQRPVVLIPVVLACAVGFEWYRGTGWQWGYLVLGLFTAGVALKRTFRPPLPRPPADAAE